MSRRPARVALVTHSVYEEDPRLRRQVQALAAAGFEVDVFALERPAGVAAVGHLDGATVVHLPVRRHQGAGLQTYLAEYAAFFLRAGWALARRHGRRRFAVVSVASPPDPLVFAALPLRLVGVPVVLDLHESTPDFFRSRFPAASNGVSQAGLHLAERVAIRFSTVALSVNRARHERLVALGRNPARLRIVANGPSLARFRPEDHPERPFMEDGSLRLVYAGAITPLYDLDVVLRAVAAVHLRRPGLGVVVDFYGRGDMEPVLVDLARTLGIADRVRLHGRIPLEDVAARIGAADIGLSPLSLDPFTEISMPTKALEYAAMGKPAIVADTRAAREYLDDGDAFWYQPGSGDSLADAILRTADDLAAREQVRAAGRIRATELSWDREATHYVELIRALADRIPRLPPDS